MIIFFFLINLLFCGILNPWFIFPSAPFALLRFPVASARAEARSASPYEDG